MPRQILVPFDRSSIALALLERAVRLARRENAGIVVAAPGLDDRDLAAALASARAIAGDGVLVEGRLVGVAQSEAALLALMNELNPALTLAPLGPVGGRPLAAMAAAALLHPRRGTIAVDVSGWPVERRLPEGRGGESNERYRLGGAANAVFRACARLRMGLRTFVGGAR